MAQAIKQKHELIALKISLHVAERETFAQIELESNAGGNPKVLAHWRVSTSDLGLPKQLSPRSMLSSQLPDRMLDAIRSHLESLNLPMAHPLWLHLVKPYGYLGVVDWEGLLVPYLGRPVFRVPDFLERPRENRSVLNVALCSSAPVSDPALHPPELLRLIVEEFLVTPPRPFTRVHIFADVLHHTELVQSFADDERVVVHDPAQAAVYGEQERTSGILTVARTIRSPWLLWMRDAMQGESLDAVHFVCHGYLSGDRPALSLTESPLSNTDRTDARYIGVAELATFLTQTGAWSAVFADPPENYSELGLRLLADTLAQARPGPVLYYRLRQGNPVDAGAAFRFLFASEPTVAPTISEMFAYCQPELIKTQATPKSRQAPEVIDINAGLFEEREDLFGILPVPTRQASVPRWIAAAQRHVESASLDLQRRKSVSTEAPESTPGIDAAAETLKELQQIVADYARAEGIGGNEIRGFPKFDFGKAVDMRKLDEEL